jgi:hypothetical protein
MVMAQLIRRAEIPPISSEISSEQPRKLYAVVFTALSSAIDNILYTDSVVNPKPSCSGRLARPALAIRIIRCLLWTGQTTTAARLWVDHRVRVKDIGAITIDQRASQASHP